MTSGVTSGSVLDRFLRIKGSSGVSVAFSSSSTSSDEGRDGATAVLRAADFFEDAAALFLVDGVGVVVLPEAPVGTLGCLEAGVVVLPDALAGTLGCFGAGVVVLLEALAGTLGCFGPDNCPRSWSGSNSIRVPIHPWVIRLSSLMRARTSLSSSG